MIICQILSTNSLSKCMKISLENLNLVIGALMVQGRLFKQSLTETAV